MSCGSGTGEAHRFDGFCHTFASGSVTALTGESGRGKSTLLYVLGLMLRPTAGEVLLGGQAVSRRSDAARSALRAQQFGFVFQDAVLDPSRSVLEAVIEPSIYSGTPRPVATARARELLHRFGLAHRADHRPGEISGGQAQRVAIARAMSARPAVVLADEPTGNLDRGNATTVLDVLRTAAQDGASVIIATHDPFVIDHADQAVHL